MKHKITFLFVFFTVILHAQDVILMTNGADISVKILEIRPETVSYSVALENSSTYFMPKNDINELRYADGKVEKIEHPEVSLEQIKNNILRYFNENEITDKDGVKLTAVFEDNYLRIKEDKKSSEGLLFDFIKVIRFDPISYRKDKDKDGFINIWTMMQTSKKSNTWDKYKLVLRIRNHEAAELLFSAFRQLNKALIKNKYQ